MERIGHRFEARGTSTLFLVF